MRYAGLSGFVTFIALFYVVVCLPIGPAASEFPQEIVADRYLLKAEDLAAAKDYEGALELMGTILELQRKHDFTLHESFHYKHARMALPACLPRVAIDAVTKYLTDQGRDAQFYMDALALLEKAERLEHLDNLKCAERPEGAACWMAVTGQLDECYVWSSYPGSDATVTFTGECSGRRAQGQGTLTWTTRDEVSTKIQRTSTGRLEDGRKHGQWVERDRLYGGGAIVSKGVYLRGRKHGRWVHRNRGRWEVDQGRYVYGKKEGLWVNKSGDREEWRRNYLDGELHGREVRIRDGKTYSVSEYERGKQVSYKLSEK